MVSRITVAEAARSIAGMRFAAFGAGVRCGRRRTLERERAIAEA